MTTHPRVETRGCLDLVQEDAPKHVVRIQGWAASVEAGAIEGFKVTVAGMPCEIIDQTLQISSPDVQVAFPRLSYADHCRFSLSVRLPASLPNPLRDALVTVQPQVSAGCLGSELLQIIAPSLPDPPEEFIVFVGSGFRHVALEFLNYFIHKANLRTTDRVLDVGCGMGRMAYGLAQYLTPVARYDGFDIVPNLIDWAQREISSRYPHFHFRHAPIYNSHYNPGGTVRSIHFEFPYAAGSFDFVFLTSVFTHMLGPEVRHYLTEIRRVLRPGGRCLITCFLLNPDSEALIAQGESSRNLRHPMGDGKVLDPADPDHAVGFSEPLFENWLEQSGLRLVETSYGSWCGRAKFVSYQDMVVVEAI